MRIITVSIGILATASLLFSCSPAEKKIENKDQNVSEEKLNEKTYTIKGKLSGAENQKLVVINEQRTEELSPIQVDAQGNFEQQYKVKGSAFFFIISTAEANLMIPFVCSDEEQISLEGAMTDISTIKSNSKETQFALDVTVKLMKRAKEAEPEFIKIQEAKSEAEKKRLSEAFDAKGKKVNLEFQEMIKANDYPLYALVPMQSMDVTGSDFEFAQEAVKRLQEKYKGSETIGKLAEFINAAKKTAVGQPAPEINLPDVNGKNISLSSLKGKVVLIDFWASWCGPCRAENPNVKRVYNKYKSKGLEIYGITLDRDQAAWKEAIEKDEITWLQVFAGDQNPISATYNVQYIPATFLLDKEGKIVAKNLRGEELEKAVANLLR